MQGIVHHRWVSWWCMSRVGCRARRGQFSALGIVLAEMQLIKQTSPCLQAPEEKSQEATQLSGRKLILLHLLKVLAGYARCLPGLCNAARFTAWHLLPQVTTRTDFHRQMQPCFG